MSVLARAAAPSAVAPIQADGTQVCSAVAKRGKLISIKPREHELIATDLKSEIRQDSVSFARVPFHASVARTYLVSVLEIRDWSLRASWARPHSRAAHAFACDYPTPMLRAGSADQ